MVENEERIKNAKNLHLPKKIKLVKCEFSLELEKKAVISSFLGSTLRGGFGSVFRRIVCVTHKNDCNDCILKEKCVYSYVFESPGENARYTYIPHPFVIEPPSFTENSIDAFRFNLVLFGSAIDYLPYFIYTFEELGNTGLGRDRIRYCMRHITSRKNLIYDGQTKVLKSSLTPITGSEIEAEVYPYKDSIHKLTLEFITPVRIKEKGRFTDKIDFPVLFKSLVRRISLLSKYHCGEEWDIKVEIPSNIKIKSSSLYWYDFERYSFRQKARMKLGGVMGTITLEGELSPYLFLLKLGEYTHIGKSTAFGLGKYRIILDK